MKTNFLSINCRRRLAIAFSLVEMVIASGIGTMVFTVGALCYQTITANQRRSVTYGAVTIGGAAAETYYGKPDTVTAIDAYFAPNYGRGTTADLMRETFYDDLNNATAVYCLARDGLTTLRPSAIMLPSGQDGKSLDTPEAFRVLLEAAEPLLAGVHVPYVGVPPSTAKNLSVYCVQATYPSLPDALIFNAIYEIDIQSVTSPVGTYATVRRYSFSILTDVYDVFYPFAVGSGEFNPLVVNFERKVRIVSGADDGYNRFRKANQEPFYFMWWPDPTVQSLDSDSYKTAPVTYSSDDPRADYFHMGGRTSYMFTFPMFPAL